MHDPPPPASHHQTPSPPPAQPRWGEPGYQGPPDPNRQTRVAVAWIMGILGGLGLLVAALAGFAMVYAAGQRQTAPVGGGPLPAPTTQPTVPPATGPDPGSATTAPGSQPPASGDAGPFRAGTAYYSIRVPDGFHDVTGAYHARHPAERDAVQALAGQPGSAATPDTSIVVRRLPAGAARGRSLDQLAADRVRALQRAGASRLGASRRSSIGADAAVEVDLAIGSGGRRLQRTQVLCVHGGRLWEVAVTSPPSSRSLAVAAWTTVKTGWQWK
jgi:hypothetical protein